MGELFFLFAFVRISLADWTFASYEDSITGLRTDCADHPSQPLKELEVFVGFVMNKSGIQTRRQRDSSVKLKDEFDRITGWTVNEMRHPSISGYTSELDALEFCIACLYVGCFETKQQQGGYRWVNQTSESFKIVAAAALLRELNVVETRIKSLPR